MRPAGVLAEGWAWQHPGRPAPAVADLSLTVEPGERVLLLGPSGAGKSTLLHALAGVLGDDDEAWESGRLTVDGGSPRDRRGRVGLMQQDPETQVILGRVGDDVAFGAENLAVPPGEIWGRVRAALADVGLGHLPLDHPTTALSGGQKQRLALAGILAMRPGLILLDEPTANLDPEGVLEVRDAVVRTAAETGATLIVVEHRVAVWKDCVDRIVVLAPGASGHAGGVLFDGAPEAVLSEAREALVGAGVWVPGWTPAVRRPHPVAGSPLSDAGSPLKHAGSPLRDPGSPLRDAGSPAGLLLSAHDVGASRTRGTRRRPAPPAVEGVHAQVSAGEALAITGPNGAGKSTFALTLAGLLPPLAGRVEASTAFAAADSARGLRAVVREPHRWRAEDLVTRIGTVFQEPEHQFVTSTVLDELRFAPRQLGRGLGRVDELAERLRLTHLAEANPYTLSGGEKRRLSVATVLAASPRVLILDEPTFGQDALTWAELAGFLVELLEAGTAVVSVTHDDEFARTLGGARLALGSGNVGLSGVAGAGTRLNSTIPGGRAVPGTPAIPGRGEA
ncbi:ATP-binding cassette domain-containing protein [Sinomonas halotolerans]